LSGDLRSTEKIEHRLKPMQELFDGEGHRLRIDGREDRYRSLLMAIETPIVNVYRARPVLKDKDVISALGEVIRFLDAEPIGSLGKEVHRWLRVCLSLNAHTRQETLAALECVLKSVKLHKSIDGPQGYLDFIDGFVP